MMFNRFARHHDQREEGHCHHRRGGRHHFAGRGEHGRGGEEHGRGGRGRHRLFEHGDLRLVLLALVERKPSHGYELIKAIEEASSGLYVPSPGVIYPTLTLLEEQDLLIPEQSENGRKSFRITPQGEEQLKAQQSSVDHIFARLAAAGERRGSNLAEGIAESMQRLKRVLRGNMMRDDLNEEQIGRINQRLLEAVTAIEAELQTAIDASEEQV